MTKRILYVLVSSLFILSMLASCAPAAAPTPEKVIETVVVEKEGETVVVTATPEAAKKVKVFGAFATPIEEPWDGVVHEALLKAQEEGLIEYTFTENIGYSGDMERVLREACEKEKRMRSSATPTATKKQPAAWRLINPKSLSFFGSGGGPVDPNFSVFDNWLQEAGYHGRYVAQVCPKAARSHRGSHARSEVNRSSTLFIAGARKSILTSRSPSLKSIRGSIPRLPKSCSGANCSWAPMFLYAERFGVIEAARKRACGRSV
jgi:hypothetical protein